MSLLKKHKQGFFLNPFSSRPRPSNVPTFLFLLCFLVLTQGQVAQDDSFCFSITTYEGKNDVSL